MTKSSYSPSFSPSSNQNLSFGLIRNEITNPNNGVHQLKTLRRNPVHDSRDLWKDFHNPSQQGQEDNNFIDKLGINPQAFGVFGIVGLGLALLMFACDRFKICKMTKEIDKYKHTQVDSNKKA